MPAILPRGRSELLGRSEVQGYLQIHREQARGQSGLRETVTQGGKRSKIRKNEPRNGERRKEKKRELWEHRDSRGTAEMLPKKCSLQGQVFSFS